MFRYQGSHKGGGVEERGGQKRANERNRMGRGKDGKKKGCRKEEKRERNGRAAEERQHEINVRRGACRGVSSGEATDGEGSMHQHPRSVGLKIHGIQIKATRMERWIDMRALVRYVVVYVDFVSGRTFIPVRSH